MKKFNKYDILSTNLYYESNLYEFVFLNQALLNGNILKSSLLVLIISNFNRLFRNNLFLDL